MAQGSRRLPEDSVVASLSEIQAILQTSERPRLPAAPAVVAAAPATAGTMGAPVPSAAEIRETREARWREEMIESQRPAPPPARRRFGALAWTVTSVALASGLAAGVLLWPHPAEEAPVSASAGVDSAGAAAPEPVAPPSLATAPISTAPSAAVPVAAVETAAAAPEVADKAKAPKRGGHAARSTGSRFQPALGARSAQSRGREVQRPKIKRKRTHADSQLDSVLDRL